MGNTGEARSTSRLKRADTRHIVHPARAFDTRVFAIVYPTKESWTPLNIETFQVQNQMILVKIAGYTEREEVAKLTNCHVGVLSAELPALTDGDYYWHELMQMTVCNKDGSLLGNVIDILPTGANDVLVVSGEKRHLIPYVPKVHIVSVDPLQRQIVVDWDENF